jgi:hypothetical protein
VSAGFISLISGWWLTYPSEKWSEKSVGIITVLLFPTEWKNQTCSKPPTSNPILLTIIEDSSSMFIWHEHHPNIWPNHAKRDGSWDQLGRRFSTFATHGPVVALAPARRSSGRTSGKDHTSSTV